MTSKIFISTAHEIDKRSEEARNLCVKIRTGTRQSEMESENAGIEHRLRSPSFFKTFLAPFGCVSVSMYQWQHVKDGLVASRTDVVDVACYYIHRRLKTLKTEAIAARLQLADFCARAGTSVPSKRLQMTGTEAAVETHTDHVDQLVGHLVVLEYFNCEKHRHTREQKKIFMIGQNKNNSYLIGCIYS
ncbi:hypothetical protein PsorP6_001553 [Peronosclerospora sorghi]|uniref:Uncharacterized protein n=1 Tax=Peronosclerospora sorghi TaxID=230839 RepID=A0ACC0WU79_9STRA|nr:hypothetical protein PsorP6_001553 [Peronosclerospora sorghi]